MSSAHELWAPTFPSLHLHHNSFSNPSIALRTSQLILQPFCCFTYKTDHSPILVASPTSQLILILQTFRHFTYVTTHSPTLPSLHLCNSSFSNPSVALPTSQPILQPLRCLDTSQFILQPFFRLSYVTELILQPFRHLTYVTTHSPTLPSLYLHHSSFSNTSVASPTSQFILEPFFRFYVTSSSLNFSWRTAHA